MAKFIVKGKRKRFIALSALALTATFSLGVFAACGGGETSDNDTDDDTNVTAPTDTQAIKNGNFEFFSEMTEDDLSERRNLINDPTSWTIGHHRYVGRGLELSRQTGKTVLGHSGRV